MVAHKTVDVDLRSIGGSALTDDIDVPEAGGAGIPVTYVPARNTIMLSLAWAGPVLGANDIFCGVNAVDYSGYPDCRPEFVAAFEALANLATKSGVEGRASRCMRRCSSSARARSSAKACAWAWTSA